MTIATARSRSWRPWQMRLRTLMVLMVIVAITASIYGWRQRREEYLLRLVVMFNASIDDQRYEEAERIALEAVREFPDHETAVSIREKSRVALALSNGTYVLEGYVCGTGAWQGCTLQEDVPKPAGDESEGCLQCQ
jgi:hypothetical protein